MQLGSLFSGCGGIDLAFEQAGYATAWQCEIDNDGRRVLRRHWPDVALYDDVRALSGAVVAPVDVIAGGFPCQDVSVAGRRAGLDGARSGLFYEITRVMREMREATGGRSPTALVLENVPGLLSVNNGRDFAAVLAELAHSGAVDICWRVLDAQYFGVPQRRRRVFLVISFGASGLDPREVLFESEGVRGHPAPRRATGQDLAGSLGHGSDRRGWRGDLDSSGAYVPVVNALTAREGKDVDSDATTTLIAHSVTASAGHHGHSSPRGDGHDNLVPVAFNWQAASAGNDTSFRGGGRAWVTRAGDYTGSLGATKRDAVAQPMIATFDERNVTSRANRTQRASGLPANTLHQDGLSLVQEHAATYAVRRLTPRECERLQGMPDDFTRWDANGRELADTHRYRLIGNSVAVPVVRWIAERLLQQQAGDVRCEGA